MKSCGHVPLVSPWLRRMVVRQAARRAAAGDVPAVVELVGVFCTAPDPKARDIAGTALRTLPSPAQADALCHEALVRDNPALLALTTERGYLPSAPTERVLYRFCTSGPDELRPSGPDDVLPFLAECYVLASAPVRLRARIAARRNKTCGTLARVLTGNSITQHAGTWSYDEWDIVITGLISEERWDELWLLATLAPIPLAITAVTALKGAGRTPPRDDRLLWDDIVATLPERWTSPVSSGTERPAAGRPAGQVVRHCFSPDGSLLATGCCDGTIVVWRTASAGSVTEIFAGPGSARFLAISADNAFLVYGSDSGTVACHCLQDNARVWSWEGQEMVTALSLSPDGRSVLIGDKSGSLYMTGIRDGRPLVPVHLHPSPVICLAHARDGPVAACGHADGTISVVTRGCSSPRLLAGNGSPVRSLAFSPDGLECLAVYEQGLPALWDAVTGTKTRTFTGHTGSASCSAVSVEGGWFATVSDDHVLRVWDLKNTAPAAAIPLYSRTTTCCSAAPDGSLLATAFNDGTIRIYRMPGTRLLRELKAHKKSITACTVAPDGTRLATISWDGTTRLWRVPKGEIQRTWGIHDGGIVSLAGPSGTLVATVTEDGVARILDGSDGSLIRTIDLYTQSVRAAAMSPDGTYLASAGSDATLRIWNIRNGGLAAAGDTLATSHRCCTFLPDVSALLAGGWDGACRIFSIPNATLLRTLSGHTSTVTCCTVSQDNSLLVTGSNDTTVRLWRTKDNEAYAVLEESRTEVSAVALSPDGTLLAAAGDDSVIRLYRLPYGTAAEELPGLPGKVTALSFTPDSCILAAGYGSGVCAIVSLPERELIRTVPAHAEAVTGIAVLSDGRTLVTTGQDGKCRFYTLPVTPFLVHTALSDIPDALSGDEPGRGEPLSAQRAFLRTMLTARFRGEIGICPPIDVAGCYDIQIAG